MHLYLSCMLCAISHPLLPALFYQHLNNLHVHSVCSSPLCDFTKPPFTFYCVVSLDLLVPLSLKCPQFMAFNSLMLETKFPAHKIQLVSYIIFFMFIRFWGVFVKLRKATSSFVISVCLSFRSAWSNSIPTGRIFPEISYLNVFRKI
jgi:hypothetical protein